MTFIRVVSPSSSLALTTTPIIFVLSSLLFITVILSSIISSSSSSVFISAETLRVVTFQNTSNCSSRIKSEQVFQSGSCIDFFSSTGSRYRVKISCNDTHANMKLFESISGGETDCERTPLQSLLREQETCFLGETTGTSTKMVCSAGSLQYIVVAVVAVFLFLFL